MICLVKSGSATQMKAEHTITHAAISYTVWSNFPTVLLHLPDEYCKLNTAYFTAWMRTKAIREKRRSLVTLWLSRRLNSSNLCFTLAKNKYLHRRYTAQMQTCHPDHVYTSLRSKHIGSLTPFQVWIGRAHCVAFTPPLNMHFFFSISLIWEMQPDADPILMPGVNGFQDWGANEINPNVLVQRTALSLGQAC